MDKELPFEERWVSDKKSIRRFSPDTLDEEFKWHVDMEDRIIEPTHENDWKFQFDNELPINIVGQIQIKKGTWHRLIKGTSDLEIMITRI